MIFKNSKTIANNKNITKKIIPKTTPIDNDPKKESLKLLNMKSKLKNNIGKDPKNITINCIIKKIIVTKKTTAVNFNIYL